MEFSSSLFVVSESIAQFKSGVIINGGVDSNITINGTFRGDGSALDNVTGASGINLFVGSASGEPPQFDEWITGSGGEHSILLTASSSNAHINHYSFIEERDGFWKVLSEGSQNGLVEKNTLQVNNLGTGVYRYLIYGHSSASKKTVVKGTTVTINPGEL